MLSVILLIFTVVIMLIGGFCGFRRGIIKQGVRIALWGVLFAYSCFFIPQIVEAVPLFIADKFGMTVADTEQLIAELLKKIEILRKEIYLILPLAGFIRSLLAPFITILFFWMSGFISWILFLIISLFLRKVTETQGVISKLAGCVLGLIFALFSGAMSLYPVAAAGSALTEGDPDRVLCKEFAVAESVAEAYDGSVVKMIYRFTGTEFLGKTVHNLINAEANVDETQNIWKQLPHLISLGSEGWQLYTSVMEKNDIQTSLSEHMSSFLDAYFSLDFISENNKLVLLKHLKTFMGTSMDDSMVQKVFDWLVIQNKEQFINDVSVYAYIIDILRQEGILDAIQKGSGMPAVSEETGAFMITTLYQLSNAEVVVPEFINLIYSTILSGAEKQLIITENLTWNEETKVDISEVVSVICKLSNLMERIDSLTMEEKMASLEAIKALKDNKAVGKENYAALLKYIMGQL